MAEEEVDTEPSAFSYIWYTAVWYLIQFAVITTLHFLVSKKLDQKLVQKSASDTLLLALVFLSLQWSQRFLSSAIYRLPYVVVHLFMDLIPTGVWMACSVLMLLSCLGLAQLLYNHISNIEANMSTIENHLNMSYFTSLAKSQGRIEDAIHKHITKQFPKLAQKLEQQTTSSPALAVLFISALLLLQLSTMGLVLVKATWVALKNGYQRIGHKRMKDIKGIVNHLAALMLTMIIAVGYILYRSVNSMISLVKQVIQQKTTSGSKNKSIKVNNGASAAVNGDSPYGDDAGDEYKQHDD